jgi:transcriptional regulator with XRE-family HTH domain
MPAGGKPTARSRRLGSALKRLRLAAQLEQEDAAAAVGCSPAKISRLEAGIVTARVGDVRVLLDLYGVRDDSDRHRLEQLARDSNKRDWWTGYPSPSKGVLGDLIALEADATYIRTWQTVFIPGLLQTPGYTRALVDAHPVPYSAADTADEMVKIRQERQRVIREGAAQFAAVIWEPAITSPMPSAEVHRDQLRHITQVAHQRNLSIQVLPSGEWAAARLSVPFVAYSFGRESAPDFVAVDTLSYAAILEDPEETAKHAYAFEALRSAALTVEQSIAFLHKTLDSIPEGDDHT